MKKLLALVSLAAFLSCEMECFKSLEKDYENIDHMLEFGAQIFLNYLDKVREIMEQIVRNNQLKKSRIAILDCWKSFKETAKKISVEERGKGVQDDYVVMARTIRRLALFYKDDVHKMYSFATENSIEQYLPAVNTFKGVIEKEKFNEILGGMESYYFPGAPSITTDPLDFLCYLLSTNTMETFIVTIVKIGADVTTQMRSIDLEQVYKRLQLSWKEIQDKATEFETLERQKGHEEDEFLIAARAAARVWLFYFDIFLENMESPEFIQKVRMAETKLQNETFDELKEMEQKLRSSVNFDLLEEAAWLHLEFFGEFYKIATYPPLAFLHMMGAQRIPKIYKALYGISLCSIASILEKLHEMDAFPALKRLHSRASVISHAILEGEEFETFRRISVDHWKSFKEEAYTLLKKERKRTFQLAEIRVMIQLMSKYSRRLFSRISGSITDNEAEHILRNLKKIRDIYTEKLLISGKVAQEELEESQRFLEEKFSDFLELLGLNDGSLWDLYKVAVAFISSILTPLSDTWNFISE